MWRDEDHRPLERVDRLDEGVHRLLVEVVRRFVEQEEVHRGGEDLPSSTRLRSPPDSTETLFSAEAPPNITAPQRVRTCVRVRAGFACRTSSSTE